MFEKRERPYILGETIGFNTALVVFFSIFYYISTKLGLTRLSLIGYPRYMIAILAISAGYGIVKHLKK